MKSSIIHFFLPFYVKDLFCNNYVFTISDPFFTVRTLDELIVELDKLGYILSCSGLYLRLQPKRKDSNQGKKHVKCLPIRLLKPQNNLRKENIDRYGNMGSQVPRKEFKIRFFWQESTAMNLFIL